MNKFRCLSFVVTFSVCFAPAVAVEEPMRCGEMPVNLFECIGNPTIIKVGASRKCTPGANMCDTMTCIFINSGWLKDGKMQKTLLNAELDQYAKDHPAWTTAVKYAKENCINPELLPQGVHLNCPAYDILFCIGMSFVQNSKSNQWRTTAPCASSKQYAATCPVCPSDCFAPFVPFGSCNACLILKRFQQT